MRVFKFGGASIQDAQRIRKVASILSAYREEPILLVVSALGKTTNALEKVVDAFFSNRQEEALSLFQDIKSLHLHLASELMPDDRPCREKLAEVFTEAEWLLHDKPVRSYDYYYDQLVCTGELLSSTILSFFLEQNQLTNRWFDVRDVIRTDNTFRDAVIQWKETTELVFARVVPLFTEHQLLVTQGFIGSTDENESTTLGREGSDYTAAVFANILDASEQTIWKDVAAVMNADPRQFPDAVPIPELNYTEVIEMAYYGAQVIHPKTIKPLQNKGIPLFVKCFLDPSLPGTVIHKRSLGKLPPIIVKKRRQVMLTLTSRDFSFVGEKAVGQLYHLFEEWKVRPNLTQNGAISVLCVLDQHTEKIDKLAHSASEIFDVSVTTDLTLLTIRHYHADILNQLTEGQSILLKQQTPETVQVLMNEKPV